MTVRRRVCDRWFGSLLLAGALLFAGCGGSSAGPSPPPPPPPAAPTLQCPANVTVQARKDEKPAVTFETPVAQGGQAPVTVACSPASGATFDRGEATVTCTATDQLSRNATCTFKVTVTGFPELRVTRFMAFGDSLTAGVTSPTPTLLSLTASDSYPFKLQNLLSARYIEQVVEVENQGNPGEPADDPATAVRLTRALNRSDPQIMLLLHGANDMLARQERAIKDVINALDGMIRDAEQRDTRVMLATHPPVKNGSRGAAAAAIPQLNAEIRKLAAARNLVLVDLYEGFGSADGLIGVDGLHPTEAGYGRMAEIWFEAIRQNLEVK